MPAVSAMPEFRTRRYSSLPTNRKRRSYAPLVSNTIIHATGSMRLATRYGQVIGSSRSPNRAPNAANPATRPITTSTARTWLTYRDSHRCAADCAGRDALSNLGARGDGTVNARSDLTSPASSGSSMVSIAETGADCAGVRGRRKLCRSGCSPNSAAVASNSSIAEVSAERPSSSAEGGMSAVTNILLGGAGHTGSGPRRTRRTVDLIGTRLVRVPAPRATPCALPRILSAAPSRKRTPIDTEPRERRAIHRGTAWNARATSVHTWLA
jgi:hypothetical protein